MTTPRQRLRRDHAAELYVRAGELEVYRQLQRDAAELDAALPHERGTALGPFARVRTDAVVDALGKTRGAINHLWGSQEAYRAAVMSVFLDDTTLGLDEVELPDPSAFDDVDAWIARWAEVEIERGPRHGTTPEARYGTRWGAWLGLVPYGMWSETIADASLREYRRAVEHVVADLLGPAIEHFRLTLHDCTLEQLSVAATTAIEGCWLNAALTDDDPIDGRRSISSSLATTLRLLVRGATAST